MTKEKTIKQVKHHYAVGVKIKLNTLTILAEAILRQQ